MKSCAYAARKRTNQNNAPVGGLISTMPGRLSENLQENFSGTLSLYQIFRNW